MNINSATIFLIFYITLTTTEAIYTNTSSLTTGSNGTNTSSPTTSGNGNNTSSPNTGGNGTNMSTPTTGNNGTNTSSLSSGNNGTNTSSPTTGNNGTNTSSPTNGNNGTNTSSPTTGNNGTNTSSPTNGNNGTNTSSPTTSGNGINTSSPNTNGNGTNMSTPTIGNNGTNTSSLSSGNNGTNTSSPTATMSQQPTTSPTQTRTTMDTFTSSGTINIEKAAITIEFEVKFLEMFTEELKDPKSEPYKKTAKDHTEKLTKYFHNVTGFRSIVILGFWEGSIRTKFNVSLRAFENGTSTPAHFDPKSLKKDLQHSMGSLLSDPAVDRKYITATFKDAINEGISKLEDINNGDYCLIDDYCLPEYLCDINSAVCVDKCSRKTCPERAECYINKKDFVAQCRCKVDGKIVFGGDNCSLAGEILELSSTEIIAVAVSVGCAVIIIAIILTVCIARKRRNSNGSEHALIEQFPAKNQKTTAAVNAGMDDGESSVTSERFVEAGVRSSMFLRKVNVDAGFYSNLLHQKSKPNFGARKTTPFQWHAENPPVYAVTESGAQQDTRFPLNEGYGPTRKFNSRSDWPLRSSQRAVGDHVKNLQYQY